MPCSNDDLVEKLGAKPTNMLQRCASRTSMASQQPGTTFLRRLPTMCSSHYHFSAPMRSALTEMLVAVVLQPAAALGPGSNFLQTVTPNQFHLILRVYYGSPEVTGNSYVPPAVVPQ